MSLWHLCRFVLRIVRDKLDRLLVLNRGATKPSKLSTLLGRAHHSQPHWSVPLIVFLVCGNTYSHDPTYQIDVLLIYWWDVFAKTHLMSLHTKPSPKHWNYFDVCLAHWLFRFLPLSICQFGCGKQTLFMHSDDSSR